jgi:DNA-directed RNA polymerase specialized sigma24 family protein
VVRDYPQVDTALIANWAEEVGSLMQLRDASVHFPDRYAYAALKGKVCDWLRTKTANEEVAGIGIDLERIGGFKASFQADSDRKILFEQVKSTLSERDRCILILLLDDNSSPAAVAEALGTSYPAAAKAIQRVKERIAVVLMKTRARTDTTSGPAKLCETNG